MECGSGSGYVVVAVAVVVVVVTFLLALFDFSTAICPSSVVLGVCRARLKRW